jgi:hypothetical protein
VTIQVLLVAEALSFGEHQEGLCQTLCVRVRPNDGPIRQTAPLRLSDSSSEY